jgi:hypothetical protein
MLSIKSAILEGKVNFENSELSFDDDSVEAFFLWFIFVSD